MSRPRRPAIIQAMLSGLGSIAGWAGLAAHPLAGGVAVVVSAAVLLYALPEFIPGPGMMRNKNRKGESECRQMPPLR